MRRVTFLTLLPLLLPACADKGATDDAGADGGATDGGGDGASGADGADGGGDGAGTGADDGVPPPVEPPPAVGIQIVDVTIDQGVRVPVAIGGDLVGPASRNAVILTDRPTVLRAFYALDDGFEGRDIFARLTVHQADGSTTEYESFEFARDQQCGSEPAYQCGYGSMPNSFWWRLPAEEMQPGVEYSIEMLETAPGHEDDVSDKVPVFPVDGGSMIIGVEPRHMAMRVVLVPFRHNIGGSCPDAPDLDGDFGPGPFGDDRSVSDFFAERLFAMNPVNEVEVVVHDVVNFSGSMQGAALLGRLQQLRIEDNAPPEAYYYGVARPCDDGPSFSGVAQLGGPSPGAASQRVGWGVYHNSVAATAGTFVHEIGHEQGRSHIRCTGDEAGADPSFPSHPDGDTLSFGIDVMSNPVDLHKDNSHDYMTYCGDAWVSEWGWQLVFPWIEEISSWEMSDAAPSRQTLLFGRLAEDGSSQWWIGDEYWDASNASPVHAVEFSRAGGITSQAAQVFEYEKSGDLGVIVPVPAGFDAVSSVRIAAQGNAWSVAPGAIRRVASQTFSAPTP